MSTDSQRRSGLGLDAQKFALDQFSAERSCEVVGHFIETESGKRDDRPQLAKALQLARLTNATLVVAKLCRLSRNVAFLAQLQDSGVKFVAADMPSANELTVHVMAAVAQAERKATSTRTREALQARKARGLALGNPNGAAALRRAQKGNAAALEAVRKIATDRAHDLAPILADIVEQGANSFRKIALELNRRGIVTARGGQWHAMTARSLALRVQSHA